MNLNTWSYGAAASYREVQDICARRRQTSLRAIRSPDRWPGAWFAAAVVVTLLHAGPAATAVINYGSFVGSTTIYEAVQESSNSGDAVPLFGPPVTSGIVTPGFPAVPCSACAIAGDSLDFNPVGFSAHSSGGGADVTDGNLSLVATAKPGLGLTNLLIQEFGDTALAGFGSDATFTAVTLTGILNISQVGGSGINAAALPFSLTAFNPSGGTFGLGSDFGGGPGGSLAWNGSLLIDLTTNNPAVAAIYAAQNLTLNSPVTKVSLNFDNTLIAISQQGTSALIAKKDHVIITTNLPEPSSIILVFVALVGTLLARRR